LRSGFRLRRKIRDTPTEIRYWYALSKSTIVPIVFAIIAGFVLYLLERNLSFLAEINWIHKNIIGEYLSHEIDSNAYVQMLVAIAGVAGVLLGLYFAAVSTVISNAYSSVSGNVQGLILKDRLGNNYVKLVAFLTAFSVVLLAFNAAHAAPLHLAIPILAIMSCVAVFAFVNLGLSTFFLSDPTLFFNTLSSELLNWITQATCRGYQWQNPRFQEHYREQASRSVTTLEALIKISNERLELQGNSRLRLLNKTLALTGVYFADKHLIPSESNWYGRKFQHKQWYLATSTELEIASHTDTPLRPKEIPDTTWFEDIILNAVFDAFKTDVKAGDYQALYSKTNLLPDIFNIFGSTWMVNNGEKWYTKLSRDLLDGLINDNEMDERQELFSVAAIDILASIPLSIELGLMKAIRELDIDNLRKQFASIKWQKAKSPYHFLLPVSTIKLLEQIREGIEFEQKAKTLHKTPNWYVAELAFNDLELALQSQWQVIMKLLESWYSKAGKELRNAKRYKHAAAVFARAIEQAWKLDSHIEQIKELSELLRKDTKIDFAKQANWDWDKEHERVDKFRDMAIVGQAQLIPDLWNIQEPDHDMPDFFGGAVHHTGEACYKALKAADTTKFNNLFRSYFLGVLGIFESIKSQVSYWTPSSAMAWLSEPVLDLFAISGYAYIFAELYGKPELWSACRLAWDTYLSNAPEQMPSFAAISNYHQTAFAAISPRSMLRNSWEFQLSKILNTLPRKQSIGFSPYQPVEHPSELICNIAPMDDDMMHMSVDAIDVFTVKYLLTMPTQVTLDFGIRRDKITLINGRQDSTDA